MYAAKMVKLFELPNTSNAKEIGSGLFMLVILVFTMVTLFYHYKVKNVPSI
jgi:hypothetical protein